jgi:hypothetical protein
MNDFKRAAFKLAVHFYKSRGTVPLSKNIQDFYAQNFTKVSLVYALIVNN